ncbi:hypothetical protein ACKI1J_37445 [Streptomyces scabiei]|uniref:hypothetical protein n=1 Tax=Streptomyces scabiei TaxID=1930 RepID=UPI0038F80085
MSVIRSKAARWLTSAAVLFSVTVVGPLVTAPAASAAPGSCTGSIIDSLKHYNYNGTHVATTYLYWDGTTNCVRADKAGSYYGVSSRMSLTIHNQRGSADPDSGYFKYYAGPVKVNGRNTCIAYELDMWSTGGADMLQDRVPAGGYNHCD